MRRRASQNPEVSGIELERLDLMAPVENEDGSTVWVKVGAFFPNERGAGDYIGTVSLLALPVGAKAPLRLYAYPAKGDKRP